MATLWLPSKTKTAVNQMIYNRFQYPERESNPHGPYGPQDFKSGVSTYSTIRALHETQRGISPRQK